MTGRVLAYHRKEGYAFIRPADGKTKDVFVHIKSVRFGKLEDGATVEYEVQDVRGKLQATNVHVVSGTVICQ